MPHLADIPPFTCLVRDEFLYDQENGHRGSYTPGLAFAVDSVQGQAVGFEVLLENGALWSRLPVHALCWKDCDRFSLEGLEPWDCFSYFVEATACKALKGMRVRAWTARDRSYSGEYLFTLSWYDSALADSPGEQGFKRGHVLKMDDGHFMIQPGNRVQWLDPCWVTKPFKEVPKYRTNTRVWRCEQ